MKRMNRRDVLKAGASFAFLSSVSRSMMQEAGAAPAVPKLLFVVAASGGGSIIDSLLPILNSETTDPSLNTYTEQMLVQVPGSAFRCVAPLPNNTIQGAIALGNGYPISNFLAKHKDDVVVMTQECTSVNHNVAARRALNGNHINGGKTLMEAMAMQYGEGMLLPNCNMAGGGYLEDGDDPTTPLFARTEPITDPMLFAFGTHGYQGIQGAPPAHVLARARQARARMEARSPFGQTFGFTRTLKDYLARREAFLGAVENGNLIGKLMLLQQSEKVDLARYGLASAPELGMLMEKFPNMQTDPFEAQAALAFLLTRHQVSCAVTISPSAMPVFEGTQRVVNPPIAFDWSHNDHKGAQNAMWSRIFKVVDGLVDLLKRQDYGGNPALGKMWDHSLIYVATEFGRDKRLSGTSSGHHLNNGNVLISPLLKGNKLYGGLDANTGLTYGFDPKTGAPDRTVVMGEGLVYSAVCHALGIPFQGRVDFPCMVRGA